MAWYAKFDGVDGQFGGDTDRFIFKAEDASSGHTGGANFTMCDGSVRLAATSAVATLMDFDTHSGSDNGTDDGLLLPAVHDDGLLLPAVKLDDGSHLLHPDLM